MAKDWKSTAPFLAKVVRRIRRRLGRRANEEDEPSRAPARDQGNQTETTELASTERDGTSAASPADSAREDVDAQEGVDAQEDVRAQQDVDTQGVDANEHIDAHENVDVQNVDVQNDADAEEAVEAHEEEPRNPFLRFPGELRNRIEQRPILVQTEQAPGRPRHIVAPALLRVNRQIRQEATPIYYGENEFHIPTPNYDHEVLLRWTSITRAIEQRYQSQVPELRIKTSAVHFPGDRQYPDWGWLIHWIRDFHAGRTDIPFHRPVPDVHNGRMDPQYEILEQMFARVELHRHRPWSWVQTYIVAYCWGALGCRDRRWLREAPAYNPWYCNICPRRCKKDPDYCTLCGPDRCTWKGPKDEGV
jgi:hypothetical protein